MHAQAARENNGVITIVVWELGNDPLEKTLPSYHSSKYFRLIASRPSVNPEIFFELLTSMCPL